MRASGTHTLKRNQARLDDFRLGGLQPARFNQGFSRQHLKSDLPLQRLRVQGAPNIETDSTGCPVLAVPLTPVGFTLSNLGSRQERARGWQVATVSLFVASTVPLQWGSLFSLAIRNSGRKDYRRRPRGSRAMA